MQTISVRLPTPAGFVLYQIEMKGDIYGLHRCYKWMTATIDWEAKEQYQKVYSPMAWIQNSIRCTQFLRDGLATEKDGKAVICNSLA
jgi:hypothetical protein